MYEPPGIQRTDTDFAAIESTLIETLASACKTFGEGLPKWRVRRVQVAEAVRRARVNRDPEVITDNSRVGFFAQVLVDELGRADRVLTPEQVTALERLVGQRLAVDSN